MRSLAIAMAATALAASTALIQAGIAFWYGMPSIWAQRYR